MNKDFFVNFLYKDNSVNRDELGYKHNSFTIYSKLPEHEVKEYCMKELRESFYKDKMPHPHVFELIEFKKVKELIHKEFGQQYLYKVRKLGTH